MNLEKKHIARKWNWNYSRAGRSLDF